MQMLKILTAEEFEKRTASGARTPVFKEFIADRETPVAALSRLEEDEEAFLLESVAGGENRGRYSYLGLEPETRIEGLDALDALKARFASSPFAPAPELPPFQGGAVGYVAYDAVKLFEPRIPLAAEAGTPAMSFLVVEKFFVFDNVRGTVTIAVVAGRDGFESSKEAYRSAMMEIAALYKRVLSAESIAEVSARTRGRAAPVCTEFASEMTAGEFAGMVEKCKRAIREGEVIQIVPSQKFTARADIPSLSLYRALRLVNPSPYNFFMKTGSKTLIGSSPEELVRLSGGKASTAPIAGTRRRGATPAEDEALERELLADAKERAEHVMLVDLARNDLGRVCRTGSVKVSSYAHVERYSHVMHIVSNVGGELDGGLDGFDLLRAAFPAGTLSGAPKVRAMELIAGFEKSPRGIYGGAAGFFSLTGDMDFAIVIRTLVKEGNLLTMRSGAGIVADSDPAKEYEETINKAKAVFEAVKFAEELS